MAIPQATGTHSSKFTCCAAPRYLHRPKYASPPFVHSSPSLVAPLHVAKTPNKLPVNGPLPPLTTRADAEAVTFSAFRFATGNAEKTNSVVLAVCTCRRIGPRGQVGGIGKVVVEEGMLEFTVPVVSMLKRSSELRFGPWCREVKDSGEAIERDM